MVEYTIMLWMGTMALLITYTGLSKANDVKSRFVALAFALLFWAGFTMHSLGYQYTTETGVEISRSDQSLAIMGMLGVAIVIVLMLDAGFQAFKGENRV